MKPLLRTHPELEIIDQLPLFIEYRVYNFKLCKNGTGKRRYGYRYTYWDVVSLIVIYFLWNRFHVSFYFEKFVQTVTYLSPEAVVDWTCHYVLRSDKNYAIIMGFAFLLFLK
jgi:hypothetical protein